MLAWYESAARIITSAPAGDSPGGSQTPALVALVLAGISGLATLYSIYRQNRNDRVANAAVHSTAANEANKQSFEQMMQMAEYQARQISELQKANDVLNHRIDELQDQLDLVSEDLAGAQAENRRLIRLVTSLGGTP